MSLDFLKQMHDQSVAKERKPNIEVIRTIGDKKYHYSLIYEPSFCDIAYQVLAEGGSYSAVCAALGIGQKTLERYRAEFTDFDIACDAGIEASKKHWEDLGHANMENKNFNDKIWKHLLTTKGQGRDPSRVVLNIDSASNAQQVADIVASLEKAGI